MKKILIALLALCMLVCFAACNGNDEEATGETTGAGDAPAVTTSASEESKEKAETTEKVQVATGDNWTYNY